MAGEVCPSCGKPIPENIGKTVKEAVSEQLTGLGDFCDRFPGLCKQVDHLGARIDHISEIMESHPVPTENLCCDIWGNCVECRSKLTELADRGVFDQFKSGRAKVRVGAEEEEEEGLPWVDYEHKD